VRDQHAPKAAEARKGAPDDPAVAIQPEVSAILRGTHRAVLSVRHDDGDSPTAEPLPHRVADLAAVSDQPQKLLARRIVGQCVTRNDDFLQGRDL
jgi:hypothetical protein